MKIIAYKGFDKNLCCKEFQYEIGKTYETNEKPVRCTERGFHSCENPIDILKYYSPTKNNKFCEVEIAGDIDKCKEDTKVASQKITIGMEIKLAGLIKAGVKFILNKTKQITGDSSPAASAGNYSPAASAGHSSPAASAGDYSPAASAGDSSPAASAGYYSPAASAGHYSPAASACDYSPAASAGDSSPAASAGYYSPAASAGHYSSAEVNGKNSIAAAIGIKNKVKAALNNWIVIAEWNFDSKNWKVVSVKTAKVDGKKIKADTWYNLVNGKFVIVNEE